MCRGFVPIAEKVHGFIDGQFQHIDDGLLMVFNIEHFFLVPLTLTAFALQEEVGHKLHFNFDDTFSFTFLAPSALDIE